MKKKNLASRILRLMIICAFLSAVSIVLGKYLAINLGEMLRISFENLPIIFAGMAFGPLAGAAVGAVADIVGCLLAGYSLIPLVTIGAACIGFVSGLYFFLPKTSGGVSHFLKVLLAVGLAHLIGSVIVKTFGLSGWYDTDLYILMLWRLLNYVIVGAAETLLLYYIMKNKRINYEINLVIGSTKK